MVTFLQKTTRDCSKSYTNPLQHPPLSSLHMLHSWHKIQKWMEATLIYTELPICYSMKEVATSLQFRLWMTETSNNSSYLISQLQGSFCKLVTHFCNLSVFSKFASTGRPINRDLSVEVNGNNLRGHNCNSTW